MGYGDHHVRLHHGRGRAAECTEICQQPGVSGPQLIQLCIPDGLHVGHVGHAAAQVGTLPQGGLELVVALAALTLGTAL